MIQFPLNDCVIVISMKGRFVLQKWKFTCSCCGLFQDPFHLKNIVGSGYWPGSPKKFNLLVDEELFIFWDAFRKRMPGSSEKSFIDTLNDLSASQGRVSISFN